MIELNGQEVIFKNFPNGECYFNIADLYIRQFNKITWRYTSDLDLIQLMFLKRYLDGDFRNTSLEIKYLPYSRMDRQNGIYPFSLKYICQFINSLNFFSITVQDAHSDVSLALLDNCVGVSWVVPTAIKLIEYLQVDTVFYPDLGAQKRFNVPFNNIAFGNKVRDFCTGKILDYQIYGDIKGTVLIIDDICSKGGTFTSAIKKFPEEVKNVYLLVSYLEKTYSKGELNLYVSQIYHNNAQIPDSILTTYLEEVI